MNKLLSCMLGSWLLMLPATLLACDICGCTSAGNQLGLLALSQKHLAGLRWQMQSFDSRPHGSGSGAHEQFQSAELWGRWNLHERLQLTGIVPVQFNTRQLTDGLYSQTSGIGDSRLLLQFSVFSNRRQRLRTWQHTVWIGGGVKLPTGGYRAKDTEGNLLHANMQVGTGSADALFSATYALKKGNIGLLTESTFRHTTANKSGYWFGNRNNIALSIFWSKALKKMAIIPQVGVHRDKSNRDYEGTSTVSESGGTVWSGSIALDVRVRNIVLNMGCKAPVIHDLAQGYVTPHPTLHAGMTWMFGGKKVSPNPIPTGIQTPSVFHDIQPVQKKN